MYGIGAVRKRESFVAEVRKEMDQQSEESSPTESTSNDV